jgi:predicted component of type VI protein secretion system
MRTSPAPVESASVSAREPWLEVRRGLTRAPRREILGRRFLIGAGSNCQLQLGGGDVPILHSILLVEEDGAHIDAVVATPQLLVNGRPQRSADLRDGDVFTIGKFEFQVHVPLPTGALQSAAGQEPPPAAAADPGQLSATELVALIEGEEELVSQFETARRNGAAALLDAVRQVVDAQSAAAAAHRTTGPEFLLTFPPAPLAADAGADEQTAAQAVPLSARRAS